MVADQNGGMADLTAVRSANPGQRLRIEVLARTRFSVGSHNIELKNRKSRAVLAYLAIAEGLSESRERLVGLLWSETEAERAQASFRQALYEVRTMLEAAGHFGLLADKHRISLDPALADIDLSDVLAAARAGKAHPLLLEHDRIIDRLLDSLEAIDPEFGDWLTAKRAALNRRLTYDLERALEADQSDEARTALAQALLNLDPTHEIAAQVLIRHRFQRGDSAGALKVYGKLWQLLSDEYDTEPSRETQALIAKVKLAEGAPVAARAPERARADPPAEPRAGGRHAPLVIAVGRFGLLGSSPEHGYLLEGFRQELLARLVRFREWRVREHEPDGRIEDLKGAYLIEGSAIVHQGEARLVVTLRDCLTGDFLWSERLPISIYSWLAVQQTMLQRIASLLNIYVSAQRLSSMEQAGRESAGAFDLWLRGQALLFSWSPVRWHEAREILQRLVADFPDFAPAYASLAQLNTTQHLFFPGIFRDRAREQAALAYAREAIRLDPVDSRAQLALGWAHAMMKQHDHAAAHHQIAAELNESDPLILASTALCASFRGDRALAEQRWLRLIEIAPTPTPVHWGYRAEIEFVAGNYDATIQAAGEAEGIVHIRGWKVAALGLQGRIAEANTALEAFFEAVGQQWSGGDAASPAMMTRWFLHAFPLRRQGDWHRLRQGFEAAGAPAIGLEHEAW